MRVLNFHNRPNGKRVGMMFALAFASLGLACLLGWQWRAQARVSGGLGCPTITFTSNMLPIITVGAPTSLTFTATGGLPAYKYAVTAGALPNNMSLAVNGVLSGAPSQPGVYYFTVTATDKTDCKGSQAYKLTVKGCPVVTIQPGLLPSTQVNTPYNATLTASGHVAPYTFILSSGALPAGMALSASGVISGTPTQSGQFNFTVAAISAAGCKGLRGYGIRINPVLTPIPSTP